MGCKDCAPCQKGQPCGGNHSIVPRRNFGAVQYGSLSEGMILDILDIVASEGVNPQVITKFMLLSEKVKSGEITDREFLEQAVVLAREAGAERTALELESKLNMIRRKEALAYTGYAVGIGSVLILVTLYIRSKLSSKRS